MSRSFYANELIVKDRVGTALKEGLASQAFHRSGAPNLGLFHGLQGFLEGFQSRQTNETALFATGGKSFKSVGGRVAIAIAITVPLIFFFFG